MIKNHDMLTYRHPRTVNQAFGVDATSANPIQHYSTRQFSGLARAALMTTAAMVLVGVVLAAM